MKNANFTHTINTKDQEGNTLEIEISLDKYFSITCTAWEKGKPKTDRNFIYGGCCHDETLKVRPDLDIFVKLHLADLDGVPMHAAANMRYHQENKYEYQREPGTIADRRQKFANDYNITADQAKILESCIESNDRYAVSMYKMGIYSNWQKLAEEGKRKFTELSGKPAPEGNPEPSGKAPDPETIQTEEAKEAAGYYTPEAIEARRTAAEKDKYEKERAEIIADAAKKTQEIQEELNMSLLFLDILGEHKGNVIYYTHSKEIAYNWRNSKKPVPEELIEELRAALPDTVIKEHKNAL